MSRIAPARPPYPEAVASQLDRIMPEGVEPLMLFRTLARSERAWTRFTRGSLLDPGPLPVRERELVILRTCAAKGSEYEWGVHAAMFAETAGLSEDEIAGTTLFPIDQDRWSGREQALLLAVDALCARASLTDSEFDDLKPHLTDEQLLELLMLIGFYHMVAFLTNALDLAPEAWARRFPDRAPAAG